MKDCSLSQSVFQINYVMCQGPETIITQSTTNIIRLINFVHFIHVDEIYFNILCLACILFQKRLLLKDNTLAICIRTEY